MTISASYLRPAGGGGAPSVCVEEDDDNGGVPVGGDVSMGCAEGEGVEVEEVGGGAESCEEDPSAG